jgi:hypothetical protein
MQISWTQIWHMNENAYLVIGMLEKETPQYMHQTVHLVTRMQDTFTTVQKQITLSSKEIIFQWENKQNECEEVINILLKQITCYQYFGHCCQIRFPL